MEWVCGKPFGEGPYQHLAKVPAAKKFLHCKTLNLDGFRFKVSKRVIQKKKRILYDTLHNLNI